MRVPPPGHIAWKPAAPVSERRWVPSGSLFSPSGFKHAMKSIKSAKAGFAPLTTFRSIKPNGTGRLSSDQQALERQALVFEREITLSTEGKPKRWSVQVPAATMNPEMVDMMLELQDLNSFFKNSLEGPEVSVTVLGKETDKLDLPSLMVSNSHRAIPLSVESSAHLQRESPIPLAARRGKSLRPLSLTEKVAPALEPYPSIPTAFLGSPSAYSPKFEYANAQHGPPSDFREMITSLRSQCDYSQIRDSADFELVVDSPVSAISFAAASDQTTDDDDDWAFAISFLDEFGSQVPKLDRKARRPNFDSKLQASKGDADVKNEGEILNPLVQNLVYSPPSPVPSTSLPATPVQASYASPPSPSGVRGILKSCKNVRFASLPDKPEVETVITPPSPCTLTTVVPADVAPPQRPSRIRAYSHSSEQSTENTPALVAPRSYRPTSSYIPAGTKIDKIGTTRPVSASPSTPVDPFQSKRPTYSSHNRSPPRPSIRHSAAPAPQSTPISIGRQSLGRAPKGDPNPGNDIKDCASDSPRSKTGSRWTMNDMTFRRGSNASQQSPDGTPKSRMPVPLRNILTRFK
ncbi:hypothetical protein D9615_003534 [Tricholomella constricta]|uniref:Uncharacterized protein n=1 Tax=Tricholomella constricta TaxID=117010 RepID=A0A8H5HHX5_9AGAR|nr:hypothetical protein D9615_003534 [Tricholomella constricta]